MTTAACRLYVGGLSKALEIPRVLRSVERLLLAHEVTEDRATALTVHQCRH